MDHLSIKDKFLELYQSEPVIVRSPGRVNLIGEHTDYNGGFVLPAAINKEIVFAIAPNQGKSCSVYARNVQETEEFELDKIRRSDNAWANYVLGVVDQLQKEGHELGGFNCVFGGDIPQGAGMSSSAALECGLALGLNEVFSLGLDRKQIAQICQKAENDFVGVKCGIMDQFANLFSKESHVIKLDCDSLAYEYYPFQTDGYKLVLLDTQLNHELSSSRYNERRKECNTGLKQLQEQNGNLKSLREVSLKMIKEYQKTMDEVPYRRCRYVIEENQRVEDACRFLKEGNLEAFGQKMYESHQGLSRDFEVSCEELDFLVEQTLDNEDVLGARMMGGGFGGCTINLVKENALVEMTIDIEQAYQQRFRSELKVYIANIVDGAEIIRMHSEQ
ncbi:MAG: galactokinase [Cyclobacteriaceae bacterium]